VDPMQILVKVDELDSWHLAMFERETLLTTGNVAFPVTQLFLCQISSLFEISNIPPAYKVVLPIDSNSLETSIIPLTILSSQMKMLSSSQTSPPSFAPRFLNNKFQISAIPETIASFS
jgi:hypothetical protein